METFSKQWHEDASEAQDYVEINIDDIKKVNSQWSEVSHLVDEGGLDNYAMINGVQQILTEDQDASLRSLVHEAKKVPYEQMAEYVALAQQKVNQLFQKVQESEDLASDEQRKLLDQKKLLEAIAPSATQRLDSIADDEIRKIKNDGLIRLKKELEVAEAELDFAIELFEKTGLAWPLPELADIKYEPAEGEIFTVDQFPNEREQISDKIAEKVKRKFESRLSDASEYLALLLKEKPGHIWLTEELGAIIYNDAGEDVNRDANRITALISNYRSGKTPVMEEIFGVDLVLQRGKRQRFDAGTNKKIPHTIRTVWRLVDTDTAINGQAVVTASKDKRTRERYDHWEPSDLRKIQLSQLPSGSYDGKSIKDAVADNLVSEPNEVTIKVDWRDVFTATVHETVESMKAAYLLDQEEITWKYLSLFSDSTKAGTKEMRERALRNKIIKRSQLSENARISASQAVMAMLQNSQPDVFRAASRRREAHSIVDEIVIGYFKAHEGGS